MATAKVKRKRTETTLALAASGLTQAQIAKELRVSPKTVQRDIAQVKPTLDEARSILDKLVTKIDEIHSVEDSARTYAELAKYAKNEAVRLATEDRIQDLRGVVTQKELVRTRRDEQSQPQAMFMLPAGTSVSVTVNPGLSNMNQPKPQDVVVEQDNGIMRNVTPTKDDG
jgi:DNA-binding XRE family transcriptional regulator